METAAPPVNPRAFEELPDPRSANHIHPFLGLRTIAILAASAIFGKCSASGSGTGYCGG